MAAGRRQCTHICHLEKLAVQWQQEIAQTSERAEQEMEEETDDDDDEEEFQRLFQDGRFWTFQGRANPMCCVIKTVEGLLNLLGWNMLLFLLVYHLACTFDDLAGRFQLKQTTVEAAINRIRPILLEVLEDRWWQGNRHQPIPLIDKDEILSQYTHIALLIDSTSVEVFCPNNSWFEEGKHYFNGKNRIYALKKEVVMMASPPHFALFSFPRAPGA
ncbi:hypothetical protein QOT17_008509 [Balamuthia mandrillaris]